jgi:hypothetical protein
MADSKDCRHSVHIPLPQQNMYSVTGVQQIRGWKLSLSIVHEMLSNDVLEKGLDVGPDLLGLGAVEVPEDALGPVVGQHRLRVRFKNLQPVANRLWFVIVSLDQILTSDVVLAGYFGRVEDEIVDPAGPGVDPAVLNPVDDGFKGNVQVDHHISRGRLLQGLSLGAGTRKAIQEPRCSSQFPQLSSYQVNNDFVGNQVAFINVGLGRQAQGCPVPYLGPEKVPARDVGQLKVPDYPVADGSLTRPWRSYDDGTGSLHLCRQRRHLNFYSQSTSFAGQPLTQRSGEHLQSLVEVNQTIKAWAF